MAEQKNFWNELMSTDEGAANYMETYGEGPGSETRTLIGSFINDGETVLDVGCGPGWNLDHFLQHGPAVGDYLGLDYSDRFVRVANARHPNRFAEGDVRHLDEANSSWDVVILQDVLEHTNGYGEAMSEAFRVARERVIVTFWRGEMHDDYADTGADIIRDDGNDGWHGAYSKKKWERYLDDSGLNWLETETGPEANRWHRVYVIYKEDDNGAR